LVEQPDAFFRRESPRQTDASSKGKSPRERRRAGFGEQALGVFNDNSTDAKLNPNPKAEEIVLSFKNDLRPLFQQNPALKCPINASKLRGCIQRVQQSKRKPSMPLASRVTDTDSPHMKHFYKPKPGRHGCLRTLARAVEPIGSWERTGYAGRKLIAQPKGCWFVVTPIIASMIT